VIFTYERHTWCHDRGLLTYLVDPKVQPLRSKSCYGCHSWSLKFGFVAFSEVYFFFLIGRSLLVVSRPELPVSQPIHKQIDHGNLVSSVERGLELTQISRSLLVDLKADCVVVLTVPRRRL